MSKTTHHKTFKIKATFDNGFEIVGISGKDLGHAFFDYFRMKMKRFVIVTGFELIETF